MRLMREVFGFTALPGFDRHYLIDLGGRLAGFAAVQDRIVEFDGDKAVAGLIGLVAVDPAVRRKGTGTALMRYLAERERKPGKALVLNCGRVLVGFYEGAGFTEIAPRAGYSRGGNIKWDEDPLLALGMAPGVRYERVFLGEDF